MSYGCRPAAAAPIRPLARELPYALGVALKKKKKSVCMHVWVCIVNTHVYIQIPTILLFFFKFFLGGVFLPFLEPLPRHMAVPRLGV